MESEYFDFEIQRKIIEAKKTMAAKGRNYDGLGDAIGEQHRVYFCPENDIKYRKLIKEIRKSGGLDN